MAINDTKRSSDDYPKETQNTEKKRQSISQIQTTPKKKTKLTPILSWGRTPNANSQEEAIIRLLKDVIVRERKETNSLSSIVRAYEARNSGSGSNPDTAYNLLRNMEGELSANEVQTRKVITMDMIRKLKQIFDEEGRTPVGDPQDRAGMIKLELLGEETNLALGCEEPPARNINSKPVNEERSTDSDGPTSLSRTGTNLQPMNDKENIELGIVHIRATRIKSEPVENIEFVDTKTRMSSEPPSEAPAGSLHEEIRQLEGERLSTCIPQHQFLDTSKPQQIIDVLDFDRFMAVEPKQDSVEVVNAKDDILSMTHGIERLEDRPHPSKTMTATISSDSNNDHQSDIEDIAMGPVEIEEQVMAGPATSITTTEDLNIPGIDHQNSDQVGLLMNRFVS